MMSKLFVVGCLLLAVVAARPSKEDKEDMKIMMKLTAGCAFENWDEAKADEVNLEAVGGCLGCFEEVGEDPMSAEGIAKIKECIASGLPNINQACSNVISLVRTNEDETGEAVMDCIEENTLAAAGERCLSLSDSTDAVEKLTDSSICMLETHKNVTQLGMYMMAQKAGNTKLKNRQGKGGRGKQMLKGYVESKLLPAAYCYSANEGDDAKINSCKECFKNMNKENFLADAVKCSNDFLLPYYDTCHSELSALTNENIEAEGEAVKKCYVRGVIKHVVADCNPGSPAADLETLGSTLECGHEYVIDWIQKNARPNIAKRLIKMIDEDDDDEDDE